MRFFVLDIETVRNSLAWEPPASRPDAFAPPPCWDIVCIGGMLVTLAEGHATATLKIVPGATPAEAVCAVARQAERAQLVTYNGRGFDLPVMESVILRDPNATAPRLFRKAVRGRYDDGHNDVCDWLTNHGAIAPFSLDLACRSNGLVGKGNVSGNDVATLAAAGDYAAIHRYCLSDVAQTGLLGVTCLRADGSLPVPVATVVEDAIWRAALACGLDWLAECERGRAYLAREREQQA